MELRVVVFEFDHILRIFGGVKNNTPSLAINVVSAKPAALHKKGPTKYIPMMFLFTPVSADVAKLVELLNLYVFNHPGKTYLHFHLVSSDWQLPHHCVSRSISIPFLERRKARKFIGKESSHCSRLPDVQSIGRNKTVIRITRMSSLLLALVSPHKMQPRYRLQILMLSCALEETGSFMKL